MFQNKYGGHDAELVRIAIHFASELINSGGYTENDADDIQQELIIAGELALPRFNPARAKRTTFIFHVLRQKALDLAKFINRESRNKAKEALSLDEIWPPDLSEELLWGDVLGVEDTTDECGVVRLNRKDLRPLSMDLQEVLKELPEELRELCRLHSLLRPDEARCTAGMAKSTHHRAIARIREFLTKHGFSPAGTDWETASDH